MTHYKSNLQAEFHYYPFGLSINLAQAFGAEPQPKLFTNQTFERNEFTQGKGLNLYDFEARTYDPQIGRWWQVDPLASSGIQASLSPYHYCYNNPINFNDPTGLSPDIDGSYFSSISSEYSENYRKNLSNAGINFLDSKSSMDLITFDNYAEKMGYSFGFNHKENQFGFQRAFTSKTEDTWSKSGYCYETGFEWYGLGGQSLSSLDPSTIGHNLLYLSYAGSNNPRSYNGRYNYSYVPDNISDYPAIGHDRRYDNLGITGATGLFTDTRAIGADWQFVYEELFIANTPGFNFKDRLSAGILGLGLAVCAIPKTIINMSGPISTNTLLWYNTSNKGVNNKPSK